MDYFNDDETGEQFCSYEDFYASVREVEDDDYEVPGYITEPEEYNDYRRAN